MATQYIAPMPMAKFDKYFADLGKNQHQGSESLFSTTILAMDKMAVGPYLWIISHAADLRVKKVGGMVRELTGLSAEEFEALPGGASELSAAEDIDSMFGFLYHSMQYRRQFTLQRRNQIFISYYFRFRREGSDQWMMMKLIEESPEENGVPQYLLAMLMDVSHIRKHGAPMMTIYDAHTRKTLVFESQVTHLELAQANPVLSKREVEVLRHIAQGYSSKMIAAALGISQKTVENHRRNILTKTNSPTSAAAITFALRTGLL
jgi:DNA-binding CsgD family transcriptional regulator